MQRGKNEHISQERCAAAAILLTRFRDLHGGARYQSIHARLKGGAWIAKQLIHPVREEDHTSLIHVVIDAEIVPSQAVAIPMSEQDFQRHKREEPVYIQCLFQKSPATGKVRFVDG